MNRITLGIIVAVVTVVTTRTPLNAQQRQKRSVTYTYAYRTTAVVRTQWSPDAPTSTVATQSKSQTEGSPSTDPQSTGATTEKAAGSPSRPAQAMPIAMHGSPSDQGQNDERSRPTFQQMQNPSGGFHLTHNSFTQNAYTSPNNYFGSQFNNWSNLQSQQFDGFNRTQPDLYFNSISYVGSVNNQWSNLTSGSISPNELGGWSYWP